MPKQLQSRHSTYHSSDISWAMLCMYISQCARRDGIEHGSIINIFLFIISCLRFDGSSHFISRSTFAELHQNGNCANEVSSVGVIVRMRRDFLSFIELNRERQLQSKAPCSLRLIKIPFTTTSNVLSFSSYSQLTMEVQVVTTSFQ